jgi:methylmalonyl-CoA mutase
MRKNLQNIKLDTTGLQKQEAPKSVDTAEGISIQSHYTAKAIETAKHLDFAAGIPPYLRGPYSTMYTQKPWTIRQYAGFSTAAESNAFYKRNLAAGQNALSVAFDLATHRGYDSDHERVIGDVGKAGVAIDTVEDMIALFSGIPLDSISVSMTMNGAILPILAFYIVAAEAQDIPVSALAGTIQNDILKEFMVRNTYIYPPAPSMAIVADILKYTSTYMPKFNGISISGYHMLEAGASCDIELAYTLADGLEYLRTGINAGIPVDTLAPRLSFFWGIGMNHFMEIAKLRAARVLWAKIVKQFQPENPKSLALRAHCQTSGWSLTAQDPHTNIARTTVEAMAAVFGGTQSLHTNALDEAMALPTDASARIARNTQLYILKETQITKTIDPWGGSFYVEKLTHDLIQKSWQLLQDIERLGGMTKAIATGKPKAKIEAAAAKKQAKIDAGEDIIVGVNAFNAEKAHLISTLEIDTEAVRLEQIKRLKTVKAQRNNAKVKEALAKLTKAAETLKSNTYKTNASPTNLLQLTIDAARVRATLGEISNALEQVFGRHEAPVALASGVYKTTLKDNNTAFNKAKALVERLIAETGRPPKILVSKIGQDGHDRGAKVIATAYTDIGFKVEMAPLFLTPKEVTRLALEKDVDVLGISSQVAGHKTLIPQVVKALESQNRSDIMVIVGGVIPKKDYSFLKDAGAAAVFGPGSKISDTAIHILEKLLALNA